MTYWNLAYLKQPWSAILPQLFSTPSQKILACTLLHIRNSAITLLHHNQQWQQPVLCHCVPITWQRTVSFSLICQQFNSLPGWCLRFPSGIPFLLPPCCQACITSTHTTRISTDRSRVLSALLILLNCLRNTEWLSCLSCMLNSAESQSRSLNWNTFANSC